MGFSVLSSRLTKLSCSCKEEHCPTEPLSKSPLLSLLSCSLAPALLAGLRRNSFLLRLSLGLSPDPLGLKLSWC